MCSNVWVILTGSTTLRKVDDRNAVPVSCMSLEELYTATVPPAPLVSMLST